jgi:hypothetical protein
MIAGKGPGIAGYHGTSIEAVDSMFTNGRLPNSGIEPDNFSIIRYGFESTDWDPIGWYARQIAVRHFLIDEIGFQVPEQKYFVVLQGMVDKHLEQFTLGVYGEIVIMWRKLAEEHDSSMKELLEMVKRGYDTRKGCVLTISNDIYDFEIDQETGDKIRFEVPGGLSDEYVLDIEPKGNYESQLWDSIMRSRGNNSPSCSGGAR